MSTYADLIERLLSNGPLPMCPYHPLSPEYLTTPDDEPCRICGQENTTEGPDKCRGADTRCMKEAADAISRLEREKAAILKVRDGYKSQMKFCDIEALGYFREFVRRIDAALSQEPPHAHKDA